jgi:hypothetical protein
VVLIAEDDGLFKMIMGLTVTLAAGRKRMKTTAVSAAAALLLVGSSALAQQAPRPAPAMSQIKYFAGSWACSGDAPASPFGAAHKTQSSVVLRLGVDGFWYSGTFTEMKTASNTQPAKGVFHLGYDAAGKQFVMTSVDNFGSWATEMSPGWQGDTMVWTGDQVTMGEKGGARDTFVKKGDAEFTQVRTEPQGSMDFRR